MNTADLALTDVVRQVKTAVLQTPQRCYLADLLAQVPVEAVNLGAKV